MSGAIAGGAPSIVRMGAMIDYAYLHAIGQYAGRRYTSNLPLPRVTTSMGKRLLELSDHEDRGAAGDIATADAWADVLGIRQWYQWEPIDKR
jgi:hypothetical protein